MKKFTKILACALAILMCMSVIVLPTFAEDETDDIEYVSNVGFEDYKVGQTVAADENFAVVAPINKIRQDEDGNRYVRIPWAGQCSANSGAGTYTGNADKAFYPAHDKLSYTENKYMMFEASYRWDAKDVTPRVELQFQQVKGYYERTDKDGQKTLDTTQSNMNWVSFLRIECSTNTLSGLQNTTGNVKMDNTQWNQIRVIFDLENGTYDVYVNGALYAYENYFSGAADGKDAGLRNVSVDKNKLIVMKCNKNINTYSEDTGKADYDVYVDMDNVRIRQLSEDDLCNVKLNGTQMKFLKGQEVSLKKSGYTFRYADVKNLDTDETTRTFTPSFVANAEKGMEVDVTYIDGEYYLYEDWEYVTDNKVDNNVAGSVPPASAYELVKIPYTDAEGTAKEDTKLKFLFSKAGCTDPAKGTGGTSYVDMNMAVKNEGITYDINDLTQSSTHVVKIKADYYFSAGAKGQIQGQLLKYVTNGETKSWGALFYVASIDGTNMRLTADNGVVQDAAKATAEGVLKTGMNFTVEVVLNLVSGNYDVYVVTEQADPENAEATVTVRTLMVEGAKLGNGNITLLPNTLLMAKLNKLDNTNHVQYDKDADGNNDFVKDSYFTVDNICIEEGEKMTVWLDIKFDGQTTFSNAGQITWWVDDAYSLEREGYDIAKAQIKLLKADGTGGGTSEEDAAKVRIDIEDPTKLIFKKANWETIEVTYTNYISNENFEGIEEGKALTTEDGFAAVPKYSIVERDTDEEGNPLDNKYLHIPFQGVCKATKWDKDGNNYNGNADTSLKMLHRAISKDVVLELRYRPHFVDLSKEDAGYEYDGTKQNPTVEVQFEKVSHDAYTDANGKTVSETTYISLFKIDLATGELGNAGTPVEGATGLKNDEWNTVKLMINVAEGTYDTYVNGKLYATEGYISKNNNDAGLHNIVILENTLIVAKLNKNVGAYKQVEGENVDRTENISYIDVDDAVFRYKKNINVTVNGAAKAFKEGVMADLSQEGSIFVYATIDGKVVYDPVFEPVEGMEITAIYISETFETYSVPSIRLGLPSGIRFVTYIDSNEAYTLRNDSNIKDFHYGTLIAPKSYVDAAGAFTMEALDKLEKVGETDITGAKYLTVDAGSRGYFDNVPDKTGLMSYAGSLANIKAEHYDWEFTAIGFIQFTLEGKTMVFYANYEMTEATEEKPAEPMAPVASLSALAKATLENDAMLNEAIKEMLESFVTDAQ